MHKHFRRVLKSRVVFISESNLAFSVKLFYAAMCKHCESKRTSSSGTSCRGCIVSHSLGGGERRTASKSPVSPIGNPSPVVAVLRATIMPSVSLVGLLLSLNGRISLRTDDSRRDLGLQRRRATTTPTTTTSPPPPHAEQNYLLVYNSTPRTGPVLPRLLSSPHHYHGARSYTRRWRRGKYNHSVASHLSHTRSLLLLRRLGN